MRQQLAYRLALVATARPKLDTGATGTVVDRIIDDVAVSIAAIDRHPVASARAQAFAHPREGGATIWGAGDRRYECEWAAWANGVATRELDFHDTYLAAEMGHPGDAIPAILAVAQQMRRGGDDLVRGILTAYEIDVALIRSISLHSHKIDHIAHLAPATAAGIGTLLDLSPEVFFTQSVTRCTSRLRRANRAKARSAPGKRTRRRSLKRWRSKRSTVRCAARRSPSPIYEGEDGIIAWMLDGPEGRYEIELPDDNEPRRGILETFTKAHSAEYQAQALIDLAIRMRTRIGDVGRVAKIVLRTSNHTHVVIGSGSNDPQKYDPQASRETLDHSAPYIFAVALEDGKWHHVDSYTPQRASEPSTVRLWRSIETVEDPEWTERYHIEDPRRKAFGARAEITLDDGRVIEDQILWPMRIRTAQSHSRARNILRSLRR